MTEFEERMVAALEKIEDHLKRSAPPPEFTRSQYEDARIVNDLVAQIYRRDMTLEQVPEIYRTVVDEELTKVEAQRGAIRDRGDS